MVGTVSPLLFQAECSGQLLGGAVYGWCLCPYLEHIEKVANTVGVHTR